MILYRDAVIRVTDRLWRLAVRAPSTYVYSQQGTLLRWSPGRTKAFRKMRWTISIQDCYAQWTLGVRSSTNCSSEVPDRSARAQRTWFPDAEYALRMVSWTPFCYANARHRRLLPHLRACAAQPRFCRLAIAMRHCLAWVSCSQSLGRSTVSTLVKMAYS